MGQVIVCEAVGEKAVITTGEEFKTQVVFKLAVNERGVMNEQSGESNTWCIELPSRTTACFFQHRLSEIAHQVPATYRLLLNLHTYISWDTCKIGAANNVHVHGKLTSMLRGLILCLIQAYNRIFFTCIFACRGGFAHSQNLPPSNSTNIIFIYLFTFMTTCAITHTNKELHLRPFFFFFSKRIVNYRMPL